MTLNEKFVQTAREYIGARKGDSMHIEIVKTYNTISPLPRGYRATMDDDWCAIFVSAVAKECGLSNFPFECSCTLMRDGFIKKHMKVIDPPDAEKGDILFYDWKANGTINHVGIVVENRAGTIVTVEGNRSNRVKIVETSHYDPEIDSVFRYNWVGTNSETISALEWAVERELFVGDGAGNYRWNDPLTREELAIVLYRFIQM